ncbi:MAG: zinc ribbon domain-containing protein [Deltaproteobacteria bacterium]|jgi:putative FmdB family regulatory protein|nr:zinc ribbon domain-containing protein [Deltaproteobacteria bacterium]
MPIYEYECDNCHHVFEINQKVSDPSPAQCPECGKEGGLHKLISHSSFQLKGSGWYASDYKGDKSPLPKPGAWADNDAPKKKSYMDQSPEERKSTIKDITSSVANRL